MDHRAWRAVNEILARLYGVTSEQIGRTAWELTRPARGLPRRELRRALARLLIYGIVQPHGRFARTVFAVDEVIEAETQRRHDEVMGMILERVG